MVQTLHKRLMYTVSKLNSFSRGASDFMQKLRGNIVYMTVIQTWDIADSPLLNYTALFTGSW